MKEPIFKATHIVKQFGPTIALNDVDIEIYPGEIRGFIGENGSGKSTMSAIMTGIYQKTSGSMEYHGKPWEPASMIDALDNGIGIIVQESGTISEISVAENIFLGELKKFSGANYFEDRKIEDFSPSFDLSLVEFDSCFNKYKNELENTSDKSTIKSILHDAKNTLRSMYETLAISLHEDNLKKEELEDKRFDSLAKKIFDEFVNEEKRIGRCSKTI